MKNQRYVYVLHAGQVARCKVISSSTSEMELDVYAGNITVRTSRHKREIFQHEDQAYRALLRTLKERIRDQQSELSGLKRKAERIEAALKEAEEMGIAS